MENKRLTGDSQNFKSRVGEFENKLKSFQKGLDDIKKKLNEKGNAPQINLDDVESRIAELETKVKFVGDEQTKGKSMIIKIKVAIKIKVKINQPGIFNNFIHFFGSCSLDCKTASNLPWHRNT